MKKIFSAFLLMTMMVFSVGSFVACSDLENEIAAVDQQTTENAEAIADLNSKLTSLQTALAAAQADADAAMKAADAAKAAAATAKAEAIEAAKAEVEKAIADLQAGHKTDIDAVNAKVKAVEDALALKADKATVDLLAATLEEYKKAIAEDGDLWKAVSALQEQIVNLQGSLQAQEMTLEDLQAAVDQLVADMKAINTNLVSIYNLVAALANQIQSIVYVPETLEGIAVAQGYVFGDTADDDADRTDVLVKMTYEVSPKGLASAITAENSAFSTVPVKAEPAEYFDVQVLSADSATGRVVVYAHIPVDEDSPAYAALAENKAVALALNVADPKMISLLMGDNPEILDAGTYVQSAYTGVKAADALEVNVYDYVNIYNTEDEEFVTWPAAGQTAAKTAAETEGFEVAWNLASSSTRNLFAGYEVRVDVDGVAMTVAEASEFFGKEIEVVYGVSHVDKDADDIVIPTQDAAKNNPFTVTKADFASTAQFANVQNVKDGALVDYSTVATLGVYLNGAKPSTTTTVVPDLTLESTYTIVEKEADVVLSNVEKDWVYTEGDYAWKKFNYNSRTGAYYTDLASSAANAWKEVELDVLANAGVENIASLFPTAGIELTASWEDADDEYEAVAVVKPLSKKAVTLESITGDPLPYAQGEEATYVFEGEVTVNNVTYTVKFNVVLGAMPEDTVIELGTYEVAGNSTAQMYVEAKDMTKAPALEALKVITDVDSEAADQILDFYDFNGDDDSVVLNGEELEQSGYSYPAGWIDMDAYYNVDSADADKDGDDEEFIDYSAIKIWPVEEYENTIEMTKSFIVNGVVFTYKATINTVKPEFTFKANDVYVKDGVAEVDGTVDLSDITLKAKESVETGESVAYTLNDIDLRNYVYVSVPAEGDYRLRYTLKTPMFDEDDEPLYTNANGDAVLPTFKAYEIVDLYRGGFGANKLNWNGLDLSELEVEVALVSASTAENYVDDDPTKGYDYDDDIVFGEPVTVKIVVPTPVKFTAEKADTVTFVTGTDATANVVKAISITDNFNNKLYSPYATTLKNIWNGYKATLNESNVVTNYENKDDQFFNVYDMKITAAQPKDVRVFLDGTPVAQSQVKYEYNMETGTIKLSKENTKITGDIKFEVDLVLEHMYDNYGENALEATAVVLFTAKETESDDAVQGTVAAPAGMQWLFETPDHGKCLLDLGVTEVGAARIAFEYNGTWECNGSMHILDYSVVPTDATSGDIVANLEVVSYDQGTLEATTSVRTLKMSYSELTTTTMKLVSDYQNFGICSSYNYNYSTGEMTLYPVTATAATSKQSIVENHYPIAY